MCPTHSEPIHAELAKEVAPTVIVVGSINTDEIISVERRPMAGETVGNATLELHLGGKGANQAVAAARCGASVAMVGRVGADEAGRSQRADLSAEGVETANVLVSEGTPTGLAVVLLTPDGENSIVVVPGANACLTSADIDRAGPLIERAAVLVAQLEVPMDAVARAIELAGDETTVVLNSAPFKTLSTGLLAHVDVLVANEHEAAALTGRLVRDPENALVAAREIVRLGPRSAIITLGPLGAVTVAGDEWAHILPPEVDVVDTTGAGDAFVGALAARLAEGSGPLEASRFGVAIGSFTTSRRGARAVVPPELLERPSAP